jgi:hypothetical protein
MPKQPGSQFWGTGVDLTEFRDTLDPIEARMFLETLGRRLFGDKYDYSLVEFRGLNLNAKFRIAETGEIIETTPYRHLMTEDGRGY